MTNHSLMVKGSRFIGGINPKPIDAAVDSRRVIQNLQSVDDGWWKWFYLPLACWFLMVAEVSFLSPAFAVELVGRVVLPADTFAPGSTTGQFKKTRRTLPFFQAQPVQGFSSIEPGSRPGTYLVLSDNGFGAKSNSPDVALRIYALEPDFKNGRVYPVNIITGDRLTRFTRDSFIELKDTNNRIGFPIVADAERFLNNQTNNQTNNQIPVPALIRNQRLLTGGDLDPESFRRVVNGDFWVGDEFGPFLLRFSANGELLQPPIPIPNLTKVGNSPFVRSPDYPEFTNLSSEQRQAQANLGGSSGLEGMAINVSRTKLYPMLEGTIKGDRANRLLIYEFDLTTQQFTGETFGYKLEQANHAIGEITAISDRQFIVIERDKLEGEAAQFKRLYKIDISKRDSAGYVHKELLVDLLRIPDPKRIGGSVTKNGIFAFPFVTIESVLPIDQRTLLVVNDNNYADSSGRHPQLTDNTEFILIRLDRDLGD